MTDKPKSRLYSLASLRHRLECQIKDAFSWGRCGTGDPDVDQKLDLLCSAAGFAERLLTSTDENELQDQIDLLATLREEVRLAEGEWANRPQPPGRYATASRDDQRPQRKSLWRRFRAWLGGRTPSIGPS